MLDILFVQNYYQPALGIMYLSALLKERGFTTDVAIGTNEEITRRAVTEKPRVIGFYCTTGFHHKNIEAAGQIKEALGDGIVTLFGGPHPTFVPEMIEERGVDIVCRGEGEYACLELMQSLREGRDYRAIRNLIVKKDGAVHRNELRPLCDVNRLPYPDRELYRNIGYIYRSGQEEVMLGRGCPFSCTFCSAPAFRNLYRGKGDYVRLRSVSTIIGELEMIQERYRPSSFFFHDETFFYKEEHYRAFLRAYKQKIDIPYTCVIRADLATARCVEMLKETGCYFTGFGVETGNEERRGALLKKSTSDTEIARCAELLRTYRIPFATFNMVGLPGENVRDVWAAVTLNTRLKPRWAWFASYQTLPGTELAQYALEKGYVTSTDVMQSDSTFHEKSIILRRSPEGRRIMRLRSCSNMVIKVPALGSFVRKVLLNLPLDGLYGLAEKFMYFVFYYSGVHRLGFPRAVYSLFFIARHYKELH